MDEASRLLIFKAQTENVRALKKVRKQINRTINRELRRGDQQAVDIATKLLALAFTAWVECLFSKLIHTPYGFTLDEIEQIKNFQRDNGLGNAWLFCLDIGLQHVNRKGKSNYLPNIRQAVSRIIEKYIVEPSIVRNKIAHGQWRIALNRDNTTENRDITIQLRDLNTITVNNWYEVSIRLAAIIESLIESPQRAFHKDYWIQIAEINSYLQMVEKRSIEDKIRLLHRKPIRG